MDDLRIALAIAGLAVVAVIYAFARVTRRRRAQKLERLAQESQDEYGYDPDDSGSLDLRSTEDATGTTADVGRLGGVFAAAREASDAEISVDISILAGLRATYESTMDGTIDGTLDGTMEATVEESIAIEPSVDDATAEPSVDTGAAQPRSDDSPAQPLSVDMSRPLVYLTLVAKEAQVSGQVVLDSLDAEGFRPGLMRLCYWRGDAEPNVVFGVANMVEPGVLDPNELPDIETPGLVTFMSVPHDGATAFRILNVMVAVSRRLARRIDATLCDETRSTLTAQAENHLREKIADALRQDRIQD